MFSVVLLENVLVTATPSADGNKKIKAGRRTRPDDTRTYGDRFTFIYTDQTVGGAEGAGIISNSPIGVPERRPIRAQGWGAWVESEPRCRTRFGSEPEAPGPTSAAVLS